MNTVVKRLVANPWGELAARWLLGLLFVFASYHKIAAPAHFAKIIYGYYLFPAVAINIIAILLPFLELFAGLALILGVYPRSGALIVNTLLLAFIVALSINLLRGQQFDCGCFSFGEAGYSYTAQQTLVRDVLLFLAGQHVLFFKGCRRWCLWQTGSVSSNISAANCR